MLYTIEQAAHQLNVSPRVVQNEAVRQSVITWQVEHRAKGKRLDVPMLSDEAVERVRLALSKRKYNKGKLGVAEVTLEPVYIQAYDSLFMQLVQQSELPPSIATGVLMSFCSNQVVDVLSASSKYDGHPLMTKVLQYVKWLALEQRLMPNISQRLNNPQMLRDRLNNPFVQKLRDALL